MPQLLIHGHRDFPAELHWQAISFMRMEWPGIEGGMLTETYPAACRPTHFALVEGAVLLSYAAAIQLQIRHLGVDYRVDGLGNVLTYPGFRGRGGGTRVVRAATDHIDGRDVDIGALFCAPSLVPFYARCGWEPIRRVDTTSGPTASPQSIDEVRMMRFVSAHGQAGSEGFETQPLHLEFLW